jgi:perosamine synthetase
VNIRMASPDISDLEIEKVVSVLNSGQLSLGPVQDEFEERFATSFKAAHGIAVSSGTAGLHLVLLAAGIGPGDAVLTTPFSFVASANAILYTGAHPVFVDVEEDTGNLDPVLARRALEDPGTIPRRVKDSANLRAVMPVHVFGQPAQMDALSEAASAFGLELLEDACEAVGALYRGRPVGTFGRAGVFAFYPNKQMTTGEGGMVITDDERFAGVCRSLRNQGRDVFDPWLTHSRLGYNYRMDELSAALGVAQLERLDELLRKRQQVANWYLDRLRQVPQVIPFPAQSAESHRSWFVFVVRLEEGIDRDGVMRSLDREGIPSRPYFSPIHLQKHFVERFGYEPGDFPISERLARSCLALPFSGLMREDEVDHVVGILRRVLDHQVSEPKI